ncbi:MAG: DUF1439 domain-containing protein [Betaproteobacteria bacterium]|nr:DUF1439 domain-containing protein [Betaproteobacteria bacterium]
MNPSRTIRKLLAALALLLAGNVWSAGLLEQEIQFSEADIQAQIDKNGKVRKSYGKGSIVIALDAPPRIRLGEPEGQATITARLDIALLDQPAVPVDVVSTAGLRYDEPGKAFYLDQPTIRSVHSAALPPEAEPLARQAIGRLLTRYFRDKPIYVLREDGSMQERTARWLLRSIRIEAGRVVAVLSPL